MTTVGRSVQADALAATDAATLVYAPGFAPGRERACESLLESADAALAISLRRQPSSWLDARGADAIPPTRFVATHDHADCVRTVSSPGDLTGLGIAVSECLDALPEDTTPGVCLDSLTTLLQYVDESRAFRFLQVLVNRVRAAGGSIHCHVNPDAHDEQVCGSFDSLFDGAITVDE
ncbi:DUF7504 family protein [Halobacterium zhouii]|uniref:DUF7504 family protein n=1 Tax=Halobacterium zhouii TaxID=2902624 RepID=UPI001E3CF9A7|nr:hypothetical protein [Halobacterium zhouii]